MPIKFVTENDVLRLLVGALPTLAIIGLWVFMIRGALPVLSTILFLCLLVGTVAISFL